MKRLRDGILRMKELRWILEANELVSWTAEMQWTERKDQLKGRRQERPLLYSANLKVLRSCWILACGLRFTWEKLLWSYLRWVARRSREITYAKKKGTLLGKTESILHKITQYLENEANFSGKTMGHCLTSKSRLDVTAKKSKQRA